MGPVELLSGLFMATLLVFISIVDLRERRIPDLANLTLLASGLVFWWLRAPQALPLQAAAAAGAFALLWIIRAIHLRIAGRTGLGLGDVKMAGAAASWFNPLLFPLFLLIASAAALCAVFLAARRSGEPVSSYRLPFGPFLSAGLFVTWIVEVSAG
jgi:leader peptidase (prepilin peptidase)/N-methyltransferase